MHDCVAGNEPVEGVDPVLRECCAAIMRDGLEVEGIFRLAGSATKLRRLRLAFNSGTADLKSAASYSNDIHSVAGVVKVIPM